MKGPWKLHSGISVIIPTHNRKALLEKLLAALEAQGMCAEEFEVVVVADGCHDDTRSMLEQYTGPLHIRAIELPGLGPAAARNAGAAAAEGQLLVFLDDDVEPTPGWLGAHAAAHCADDQVVVLGPYPPHPHAVSNPFRLIVRHWWSEHVAALARPGHRYGYRDLLTGNLSLAASLWRRFGGLDPRFRRAREDHEFGVRLMQAGVTFVFAPRALAFHHEHETMTLEGAFRRAIEEGRSDALMGVKHPEIRSDLNHVALGRSASRRRRRLYRAIFRHGRRIDRLAAFAALVFPRLERRGLRTVYGRLYRALNHYWYMRGVAEHFGSFGTWNAHLWEHVHIPDEPPPLIDLRPGLAAAEAYLDRVRPQRAKLHYGKRELGDLPFMPGRERWRGEHLRPIIADYLAPWYLQGLVRDGVLDGLETAERRRIERNLGRLIPLFGATRNTAGSVEQVWQWNTFGFSEDAALPAPVELPSADRIAPKSREEPTSADPLRIPEGDWDSTPADPQWPRAQGSGA